jgi:hypothetical protein
MDALLSSWALAPPHSGLYSASTMMVRLAYGGAGVLLVRRGWDLDRR